MHRIALAMLLVAACHKSGTHEAAQTASADPALTSVLSNPARTDAERARDTFRHPAETLSFFGLKPDMHVVELVPGGGWYTAILAPHLHDKGALAITSADPNGPADG